MTCRRTVKIARCLLMLLFAFVMCPQNLFAEDDVDKKDAELMATGGIGVDPGVIKATSSGGDSPPPLTIRTSKQEWQFGYHGYLRAPARFSFDQTWVTDDNGNRVGKDWKFTSPPQVPDGNYTKWAFTNNISGPWAEMIFSYGNSVATASAAMGSYNITEASYNQLQAQLGIDGVWLTLNFPTAFERAGGLKFNLGVFSNRYGQAGRYDAGKYDTYMFGRTHITGETTTAFFDLTDKIVLQVEHGFGAKTDFLPKWVWFDENQGGNTEWTPYAGETVAGATMVNHAHLGVIFNNYKTFKELILATHFMHGFTADADESKGEQDAKLMIMGGEAKVNGGIFGDIYLGYAHLIGYQLRRLDKALESLHSEYGYSYIANFFGPQGDFYGEGTVDTIEFQYMLSLSKLVWYLQGKEFWGQGPDFQIQFFGMLNLIDSNERVVNAQGVVKKFNFPEKRFKWGSELTYIPISWFGLSVRYDQVHPDWEDHIRRKNSSVLPPNMGGGGDGDYNYRNQTFHSIAPKLRFKTAFLTHEEVIISYHRYFFEGYNSRDVFPLSPYSTGDLAHKNGLSIAVTMWW